MSDIVERLRTLHRMYSIGGTTLDQAADTITSLRERVAVLEGALAKLAGSEAFTTSQIIPKTPLGDEMRARMRFAEAALGQGGE